MLLLLILNKGESIEMACPEDIRCTCLGGDRIMVAMVRIRGGPKRICVELIKIDLKMLNLMEEVALNRTKS